MSEDERAALIAKALAPAPTADDLPPLVLEPLDFVCPTCGSKGGVPCVDEDGAQVKPHDDRAPTVGR